MPNEPAPELSQKDRVLLLYGYLNAYWDYLEQLLFFAFYALTDDGSGVSRNIFYSQRSHTARRAMVEVAAKQKLEKDPASFKALNAIINRIKARSNKRNLLVHGVWRSYFTMDGNTFRRVPLEHSQFDLSAGYSEDDIRQEIKHMIDTVETAYDVIRPICAKMMGKTSIPFKTSEDGQRFRDILRELMDLHENVKFGRDTLPKRSLRPSSR
jgi:hypothetical protein